MGSSARPSPMRTSERRL
ncbi:MAG: hypothetical protein IKD62_08475 [Oscillospiraceae bacterium]|nr:hypothetical protein [Oscillospiraceae bacterium]